MEDDDDLYEPGESFGDQQPPASGELKMEELEEGEEEDSGEEDSDDEINFITDAKAEPAKSEPPSQLKRQVSASVQPSITPSTLMDPRVKPSTPLSHLKQEATIDRKPSTSSLERPGTDYPARHTSTIDPNANPIHPGTGKPILSTDFDTDFASESSKPWRKPGSDISDYFNYGFDEFTWASYCLKRQTMPKEVAEIKNQADSMKAFVEGIAAPGIPGMPGAPGAPVTPSGGASAGGMSGMPGMPSEAEMQQMFAGMMSQGMNPATMDPNQFMQMMMGGGGPPGGQGGFGGQDGGYGGQQGGQQGGYGGGGFGQQQGGGGGGYRGRGRGRW